MPALPIVDSQRQLSTSVRTAAPIVDTTRDTSGSDKLGILSKGLGQVQKIAQVWANAVDTMQATAAKSKYETGMADIFDRAKQAPYDTDPTEYIQEMEELQTSSAEGFSNKALQEQIGLEFEAQNQISGIDINNIFRQKSIEYTRAVTLPQEIEKLTDDKIAAGYGTSKYIEADRKILEELDHNVRAGIISHKEKNHALETSRKKFVDNSLWDDPELFKAELSGLVEKGLVKAQEREKLTSRANSLIKKRKEIDAFETKVAHTRNAIGLAKELMQGTLTPERVDDMARNKEIDPKVSKAFVTSFYASELEPTPGGLEFFYIDMLDKMTAEDGLEGAVGAVIKATEAYSSGRVGLDAYTYFIDYANSQAIAGAKRENLGDIDGLKAAQKNIEALGYVPGAVSSDRVSKAFGSFFTKLFQGAKPDEAVKEVQKEAVIDGDPTLQTEDDPVDAAYRKEATRILRESGFPVTDANINNIISQARSAEGLDQ